jgi:hypothetical protein
MLSFRERNPRMRFRIYWDQWHDWLLPKVLKSLEDVGQKESFLKFMGLIASGTFPLHNICYLLFLDIVEWFSCDSTTHMSYAHETVKFWQIGYRLFHGKFLRFMSGIRNFGQVLDGTSEKGFFDSLKSKVNCAVPNGLYVWKPYYKHRSSSSLVNLSSPLLQEIRPKRTRQLAPPSPVQYHRWVPLTFLFEKGKR